MVKEFKEFIMRGNVVDMAVGIIIGAAFGKIVTSFVNDILMPPIGLLLGKVDFSNLFIVWQAWRFHPLIVHDFYAFGNPTALSFRFMPAIPNLKLKRPKVNFKPVSNCQTPFF